MHKITIPSRMRHFKYTAHLANSGRLLRITAGCRTWRSFSEAKRHYEPARWWGFDTPVCAFSAYQKQVRDLSRWQLAQVGYQQEALNILDHLEHKVARYKAKKRSK